MALIGPFAGPYIDRWDRRRTMIVADLLVAASSLVLMLLFAMTEPSVGMVIGFIALRSAANAFHLPASQAAVPMYVPADQLTRVAGWNFFLQSGSVMAGPVLGAFFFAALSVSWALALDVLGALLATGSLLLVRIPHPVRAEEDQPTGILQEMRLGWRTLVGHRGLFTLALVMTVATFIYIPVSALFPLMTLEHFQGTAWHAGLVELAFGGGMLLGSVAIGVAGQRAAGVGTISLGILLLGATLLLSGLLPASGYWVFALLCVAMGCSAPLFNAPTTALYQSLVDPALLGRVLSLVGTMALIATPAGLLVSGPGAERVGVPAWFAVSGALLLLLSLYSFSSTALKSLRAADAGVVPERDTARAIPDTE
jgi:DHA3 family macrolide efflux protein-like MFS transporter